MGKKSKTAAVLTGVAAVGAATAAIIASQKKKGENGEVKDFNLDEKFVDFKNRVEDLMITVDNATADSREDIKVTLGNIKGDAVHYSESLKRKAERSKSKLTSELIKAKMNFDVKKEEFEKELDEKKFETEKKKEENKAIRKAEEADILMDYALEMVQQATIASLEATSLADAYEEKYGETIVTADSDLWDDDDDDEAFADFDEDDIEE